jgi:hypothetical protein
MHRSVGTAEPVGERPQEECLIEPAHALRPRFARQITDVIGDKARRQGVTAIGRKIYLASLNTACDATAGIILAAYRNRAP